MRQRHIRLIARGAALAITALVMGTGLMFLIWWLTGDLNYFLVPAGLLVGFFRSAIYKLAYEGLRLVFWRIEMVNRLHRAFFAKPSEVREPKDDGGGWDT